MRTVIPWLLRAALIKMLHKGVEQYSCRSSADAVERENSRPYDEKVEAAYVSSFLDSGIVRRSCGTVSRRPEWQIYYQQLKLASFCSSPPSVAQHWGFKQLVLAV